MKNIIICGAGHGGLVAAAKLAEKGFNVKIYEKKNPDTISWDWRDNIDPEVFERINYPLPEEYLMPANHHFVSPNEKHELITELSPEERNITLERRYLVKFLIEEALSRGAKIFYEQEIVGPILENDILVGIKTKTEEIKGDLIVDATGVNAPIRKSLPDSYGMKYELKRGELFHTYRAYFNKNPDVREDEKHFTTIIGHKNKRGISWVNTSNEFADVLIGCIDPYEKGELNLLLAELRKSYPIIGEKLLRGGIVAPIPIRRTYPILVGPNYALTGDAAWMARPINGSGIEHAMIAGDILAETIIKAHDNSNKAINVESSEINYSTAQLWPYEYDYIHEIGAKNAFIDNLKDYLMITDFKDLNFAFEKRLLMAADIEAGLSGKGLEMSFFNLMGRLIRGIKRIGVLVNLGKRIRNGKKIQKEVEMIPKDYEPVIVNNWIEKTEALFNPYYEKLEKGYGKTTFKGN